MRYTRWELRRGEEGYPACLEQSPRPPEVLYGMGDPGLLRYGLGVVGARKATPYGLSCAAKFAGWAANRGVVVVSGGAIGCDQEAHRAALSSEGATVAVLGCGPDIDYPRGARSLLDQIRGQGACVSELPWGSQPARWTFVERNRLIAALSAALLVVEAGLPSGTFSTADFALEAGRDVLAVPGSVFAPECRGANRLIRQGAVPITDISELASSLESCGLLITAEEEIEGLAETLPMSKTRPSLNPFERRLLAAVRADAMRPDDCARALDTDIVTVVRTLGMLEARGVVARYPGGRYGPRE